jgi:hypothetical protein
VRRDITVRAKPFQPGERDIRSFRAPTISLDTMTLRALVKLLTSPSSESAAKVEICTSLQASGLPPTIGWVRLL